MNPKYAVNKYLIMSNPYKIQAFWDQEAEVWVAESQDILGLVTEAETLDQLTHKLKQVIPNLLIANHLIVKNHQQSIAFELITHRQELIQVA
jgi:predicted RNase H-like HicB family nuclease